MDNRKNKYDLSEFSEHHPGGRNNNKRTKGLDVTTLFLNISCIC